jgi:hypothetical protein
MQIPICIAMLLSVDRPSRTSFRINCDDLDK